MRIVIAGGSGFLGEPLVRRLAARGDDVAVLSRNPSKVRAGRGVSWDGRTQGAWAQEVAGVRTDELPEFAWMSAEAVVEASLEALRKGERVVIPGATNKVMGAVIRAVPAALARRVGAVLARRTLPPE